MKLNIQSITKSYGSNLALNKFTTTLEPGIYAILGPNGSGKSTLMNIITDNLKADSGEITYTSDDGTTEEYPRGEKRRFPARFHSRHPTTTYHLL